LDIIFNNILKRVIRSAGVRVINRWRIYKVRWKFYGLFLLLCTSLIGGDIKVDVEKTIRNQFGNDAIFSFQKLNLSSSVRTSIEKKVRQRFFKDFIYVWSIMDGDSVQAYALLDNVKGLSMPITFLVIYDIEGTIISSHVIKYREPYGGEIASPKWTAQFNGRNNDSDYNVGGQIDGISGATISVYSMSAGIMKLSLLFPKIKSLL